MCHKYPIIQKKISTSKIIMVLSHSVLRYQFLNIAGSVVVIEECRSVWPIYGRNYVGDISSYAEGIWQPCHLKEGAVIMKLSIAVIFKTRDVSLVAIRK